MSTYKTTGIILKRNHGKSPDRIVTIYTKDFGKVIALAKGVKKTSSKLAGHLEPFIFSDLLFVKGRNLDTIAGSFTIKNFSKIRLSYELISAASYLVDLVDKLTPLGQSDTKIFNLLLQIFSQLESWQEKQNKIKPQQFFDGIEIRISFFEFKLLEIVGYKPFLQGCVNGHKISQSQPFYFNARAGGLVCKKCLKDESKLRKITPDLLEILKNLSEKDFNFVSKMKLNKLQIARLKDFNKYWLRYVLESQK